MVRRAWVGVCLERFAGAWWLRSSGILKAGGAYPAARSEYPASACTTMLADAGRRCCSHSNRGCAIGWTRAGVRRLELDREAAAGSRRIPASAPASTVGPHKPRLVIYTSGSTGTPRALRSSMQVLPNKILTLGRDLNVGSSFRSALVISCAFDASIEQALLRSSEAGQRSLSATRYGISCSILASADPG